MTGVFRPFVDEQMLDIIHPVVAQMLDMMNMLQGKAKKNEPQHQKTCFCHMRTTKAQIVLCIRAVWSAPLLFTAEIVQYL